MADAGDGDLLDAQLDAYGAGLDDGQVGRADQARTRDEYTAGDCRRGLADGAERRIAAIAARWDARAEGPGDKPPELVCDDPAWMHSSPDGPRRRRLRIWRTAPGQLVALVTERCDPTVRHAVRASVTHEAHRIGRLLSAQFPGEAIIQLEHYTAIPAAAQERARAVPAAHDRGRADRAVGVDSFARVRSDAADLAWEPVPAGLLAWLGVLCRDSGRILIDGPPPAERGRRIVIVGAGGSGKTVLARTIGSVRGIPVIHLDALLYDGGWRAVPANAFARRQREAVSADAFVVEGNYASTLPIRLERADTVVLLDLPPWQCLAGIARRRLCYRGGQHRDGVYDRITVSFLRHVLGYRRHGRPLVEQLVADFAPDAWLVRLSSWAAAEEFARELAAGTAPAG